MHRAQLIHQIRSKKSFLCVGLDTDTNRLPPHLRHLDDAIFQFNKAIIDATKDYCVAYKLNTAFYEAHGIRGWEAFQKSVAYIPDQHLVIADAKRGDIGNTSKMYAKAFFDTFSCDAITVAPYMGRDSIEPFLQFDKKWVILLGLTSNPGSADFQLTPNSEQVLLFEQVLRTSRHWGRPDNMMYVIGATHPGQFKKIRQILPEHFLLVPGIGAQGGDLEGVCANGLTPEAGLLVNASRGIIYHGSGEDFDIKAGEAARTIQQHMAHLLERHQVL